MGNNNTKISFRWCMALSVLLLALAGCSGGGGSTSGGGGGSGGSQTDPNSFINPPTVQTPNAQVVNTPQAARHHNVTLSFNESGNGIAVWESGKEYGMKLLYSLYDSTNNAWSSEEVLASIAEANVLNTFSFAVASNASGFAVTWRAHAGTNDDHLYAKVYSSGTWSAITRIDNVDTTFVYTHKLTASSNGYLAVWEQNQKIYSSAYVNGAWSAASQSPAALNSHLLALGSNGSGYLMTYCQFVYNGCTGVVTSAAFNGAWGQPLTLDVSTAGTAQAEIASNGSNYLMIMDDTGLQASIYNGSAWSLPENIAATAYQAHVKSNGSGYAVAYTTSSFFSSGGIYTRLFDASAWSSAQLMDTVNANSVTNLALTSSGADYGVSWLSTSGSGVDLRAAITSAGVPQTAVTVDDGAQKVTYGTIAGKSGGFAFAWVQYDGAVTEQVYTRTLSNATLSAKSSLLQTAHDSPASNAVFAVNSNGDRVAVWTQEYFDPGYDPLYPSSLYSSGLFASVYSAGTWGTATLLYKYGVDPIIVTNGQSFLVAYHSVSSPGGNLYASLYKNGVWSASKLIGGSVYEKSVASSSNGYAVVWEQNTSGDWGEYVHIYDETTGWDVSSTRLDNTTGSSYLVPVVSNGSGYAVAWSEADSSQPLYTYASVYDSGTKVWTRTALTNTYVSGASIVSSGSGYAVAWSIVGTSVFARVFNGGTWQAETTLGTSDASIPIIKSNGTGYAAVWGGYPKIYSNVFNGTSWSGEVVIGQPIYSVGVRLAANSQGYLAYWNLSDATNTYLYTMLHNGTQWQATPTLLEQNVTPLKVVGNGTGYAMVWKDDSLGMADHSDIGYRIYDGSGWLARALLENSNVTLPFALKVDLARDGAGYAAVWVQAHEGYTDPAVRKVWHTTF